jgi:biopolymer transport protein ExbB
MLGVVANLAPMLGLLGTVLGMIKAFAVISKSGTGNPGLVASGISEALITTATGLAIGIPALALYHYFRGKIDRIIFEMEEVSLQLIEELVPLKMK